MIARVLTPADAPEFHAVRLRSLREHPHAYALSPDEVPPAESLAERFRDDARTGAGFVMGVFDPALIGIAGCRREPQAKTRHAAYVWGVYVAAETRGKGAGRILLAALIERARQWPDVEQLALDVSTEGAQAARALYGVCGFQRTGRQTRKIRVGDRYYDQDRMELSLR